MHAFDQAVRYSVRRDPTGFFRWLAPALDASLRFHGWLDPRTLPFPGERDRICDTVAELADPAAPGLRWAVVTEFHTEPESDLLDRLLK